MKRGKRMIGAAIALALLTTMAPATPAITARAQENGGISAEESSWPDKKSAREIADIRLSVGDGQTSPQYQAGEKAVFSVKVTNKGTKDASNVRITPVIDDAAEWPFEIQNMNEEQSLETLASGETKEATWEWTVRSDVETKAYKTRFRIAYTDETNEDKIQKVIYIKTTAQPKEEENPGDGTANPAPNPEGGDLSGGMTGGEVYNGEPMMSGGGEVGKASVPRVIVTGFSTEPGSVNAGSNFRLVVHVKNTSNTTAVSNMLFDFQAPSAGTEAAAEAPAFLPASGSSSVYLDSIPAGGTKDIAIDLNARADLVKKPYSIVMSMKYEDSEAAQYEASSSLAIPVQQPARFEFSEIEVGPTSIQVGEEANLTCSLYNTGRTKLYNVKVKFSGDGISGKDVFVGNVDSGATGTIDAMLLGESEIPAGTKCKMVVSYEDESGNVSTKEEQFELEVLPAAAEDVNMMTDAPVEEKGFPVLPVVIGVVVVAAIAVTVVLIRRRKKKLAWAEEEDLADEVDRFTEDE